MFLPLDLVFLHRDNGKNTFLQFSKNGFVHEFGNTNCLSRNMGTWEREAKTEEQWNAEHESLQECAPTLA